MTFLSCVGMLLRVFKKILGVAKATQLLIDILFACIFENTSDVSIYVYL